MTYATHWSRFWSLLVAAGVGLSLLVWPPMSVLTVFLTGTACAAVLLAMLAPAPGPHSQPTAVRWLRIGTRSVVVGGTTLALGACSALLPYLVLPLVALAVVSSPAVARRVRRRGHHPPAAADSAMPTAGADPWTRAADCRLDLTDQTVQTLTARELCDEWRRTLATLRSAGTTQSRVAVVAQRQLYLDEMERRSPAALHAWLASGADAAGGPDRFLVDEGPRGRVDPA
jgi:hypothetical protein